MIIKILLGILITIPLYFIIGLFITLPLLIMDIILVKRLPALENFFMNYFLWPLTFYYFIRYIKIGIDFIKKYKKKNECTFNEALSVYLNTFDNNSNYSLFGPFV